MLSRRHAVTAAIAACGLCAVVLSQSGRGQIARLELGSDASLISVLDHSGPNNVHNAGELQRGIASSQILLGELHSVSEDPGERRGCWVRGSLHPQRLPLHPLSVALPVPRLLGISRSPEQGGVFISAHGYLSVPMSLTRVGTPRACECDRIKHQGH